MEWSVIVFFVSEALLAVAALAFFLLWRAAQRQTEELNQEKEVIFTFMHDVAEVFAETDRVDPEQLLKRVLFYALRTTKASSGAIFLLDERNEKLSARAISGIFPPLAEEINQSLDTTLSKSRHIETLVKNRSIKKGEGLVGEVADLGAPVVIVDGESDPRVPKHALEFLRIQSLLLVPMRFHQQVLGVLAVANRGDGRSFSQADLNLLQALADQASASVYYAGLREALDEKKRIDHDLAMARHIQRSLLPKDLPKLSGLEIAAFNEAAQQIGGDYYDVIRIDEHHIGIAIADVSGKGIGGAMIMSICRSILRAQATGNLSPASVLKSINRVMSRDIAEDMFITMTYMVVHLDTHEVTIARAGHERLLLVHEGELSQIESPGSAIGLLDEDTFEFMISEKNLKLAQGDVLVLYTDGITEAMNDRNEEWGLQSLIDTVQVSAGEGAHSVLNHVRQRIQRFVGDRAQYDDMTLLVMRYVG